MAFYMFFFAAHILKYMLKDPQLSILGFVLSDNIKINNQIFVDNIALYLKDNPQNLTRTMNILNRYCKVLEAKVNWYKISIIWTALHA